MTFWDGFLPALGAFTAAGIAYIVWRFWKVVPVCRALLGVGGAGFWAYNTYMLKPLNRFAKYLEPPYVPSTEAPTGRGGVLTFDDLIPGTLAWLER
ncbi:hypothetical protein [Rhizobium mesoamericanum]|uniref:hypothetical protein n=1 Tax=Rhizobium mesoamericanum TaxID=1079800 RepID=UPI00040BD803|nr:hypothetical protein [Rhizobium mesoamericanum]